MARPVKRKRICEMPLFSGFIPSYISTEEVVQMAVEEYEVIRLIDYLGFTQEESARQMNVARTTVQAMYDTARKKLANMLVNGRALSISGGSYDVCPHSQRCCGKNCDRNCDRLCEENEQRIPFCSPIHKNRMQ